jgi:NitT/TauT family transport system substrate-binding protein
MERETERSEEVAMRAPRWRTLELIFIVAVVTALLAGGRPAVSAEKLRAATGGYSPSIPPYFSYAVPFFLKQDIDGEDVRMSSGSLSGQALTSGDVKLLLTTGAIALQANMAGGEMVIIAGVTHRLPYQIIARPEIKTAADLKGKRIGISRFGSSSEWIVRLALAKLGLDPDKDFALIQAGGQGERLAAMQSGAIQATQLAPPISNTAVQKLGMRELMDISKLDITYPLVSVITTRSFLQSNRPLVKRFLTALTTALHAYQSDPQSGVAFQAKQFKFSADQAEIGYRSSVRVMHPDLRVPERPELDLAMKEIAARVERARGMSPADLRAVDGSLREELAKDGLFDRLARKRG